MEFAPKFSFSGWLQIEALLD